MEQQKYRVLLVESQEDWLGILKQALSKDDFDCVIARSYDEALFALQNQAFSLAVIDPALDSLTPPAPGEPANDGLQLLSRVIYEFPQMHVVVVSGSMGREMLRGAQGLPPDLPVILKQNWDRASFTTLVIHMLSEESWGPPEPKIEMPADAAPPVQQVHGNYPGLTGPLPSTGMTGPLPTGLIPPPLSTSSGKPRVLIIEADVDWQHNLARLMESEGYFWRVASDFDQALERLRLESFHVVLLDLKPDEIGQEMTAGQAWQLLDHLIAQAPKTKIIIASGTASRRDVARLFMRYPIKGFIDKVEFYPEDVIDVIRAPFAGPSLKIQTLGDFRIWRDGKSINSFGDSNAERLMKILITRRGESVSVEELIEYLWPKADVKTTSASLGTTISNARTALESDLPRPNDSHFILRNGANYMFNFMANVEIDAEQLRRLVSEGRQHDRHGEEAEALQAYEAARAIYQGDYLPAERFERWAIQERSALQGLYTDALNRIADLYAEMDKLDQAIEAATRSLQANAYVEATYRRLMRYHACKGDRTAALSVYRSLVKLFSEFFGEEPDPVTKTLRDDIEAGRPVECAEGLPPSGEWRLKNE